MRCEFGPGRSCRWRLLRCLQFACAFLAQAASEECALCMSGDARARIWAPFGPRLPGVALGTAAARSSDLVAPTPLVSFVAVQNHTRGWLLGRQQLGVSGSFFVARGGTARMVILWKFSWRPGYSHARGHLDQPPHARRHGPGMQASSLRDAWVAARGVTSGGLDSRRAGRSRGARVRPPSRHRQFAAPWSFPATRSGDWIARDIQAPSSRSTSPRRSPAVPNSIRSRPPRRRHSELRRMPSMRTLPAPCVSAIRRCRAIPMHGKLHRRSHALLWDAPVTLNVCPDCEHQRRAPCTTNSRNTTGATLNQTQAAPTPPYLSHA